MIFLEQICSKRVFPVENGKREHHHCILIVRITVSIKFPFTQAILNFGTKFARKKYSRSKTKKKNITIKFYVFELSMTVKFHFKQTILNFKIKFARKRAFSVENGKSEHHHWILYTWINVGTKFHFKQTALKFESKFTQKEYFWSKTKKVNITTEFYIFKFHN